MFTIEIPRFLLYMIPYLIIGYDILLKAWKGIKNRQPFDESLLMAIATVGAIIVALTNDGSYTEAIGVMLFYQIGGFYCQICQSIHANRCDKRDCAGYSSAYCPAGNLASVTNVG